MRSVLLIAKGPSAERAESVREEWDTIATINDSGRYVNGAIDYAFVSDGLHYLDEYESRINRIVTPAKSFDVPQWYNPSKHITYLDSRCCGDDEALRERINVGGICHHHTTTGAMHWLAKVAAFDIIKVIGVDGGNDYAKGSIINAVAHHNLRGTLGDDFLDSWKDITVRLGGILTEVYGTEVTFYD